MSWETSIHVKLLCRGQYQLVTPAKFSVKMSQDTYHQQISFLLDCFIHFTTTINQGCFHCTGTPKEQRDQIYFSLYKYVYKKILIPAPESLQSRNQLQLVLFLSRTNKGQLWVQEWNLDLPVFRFSHPRGLISAKTHHPHGQTHRLQYHSPRGTLTTGEAGR